MFISVYLSLWYLGPLPRNKNRPDIKNGNLPLSYEAKILEFSGAKYNMLNCHSGRHHDTNQVAPLTKTSILLANGKYIVTCCLSALKVGVLITAKGGNKGKELRFLALLQSEETLPCGNRMSSPC
jgi:hypothetical protein